MSIVLCLFHQTHPVVVIVASISVLLFPLPLRKPSDDQDFDDEFWADHLYVPGHEYWPKCHSWISNYLGKKSLPISPVLSSTWTNPPPWTTSGSIVFQAFQHYRLFSFPASFILFMCQSPESYCFFKMLQFILSLHSHGSVLNAWCHMWLILITP